MPLPHPRIGRRFDRPLPKRYCKPCVCRTIPDLQGGNMRFVLAVALAFATVSAFAEAADKASDKGKEMSAKAVNTVCPLDGAKVDAKVAPVSGKTKEGKEVSIGSCCAECAGKIKEIADSSAADAAVANKKMEEKVEKKK